MFGKPWILIAIFLATVILVPVLIIIPSVKDIKNNANAIYQEYDFLEEKHRRGQGIRRAINEYNELAPYRSKLRALAIEPKQELVFITALEKLAADNNVEQELNLNINNSKERDNFKELSFELTLNGSYANILRHIASLRQLPMVTPYSNINFTIEKNNDKSPNTPPKVTARLKGVIFQHIEALNNAN